MKDRKREWTKLHIKIAQHEIMRDHKATTLFIYLLSTVDDFGNGIVSRFATSRELAMKPITFYKCLCRLQKKYDLVTLSGNNRFTNVFIKNWNTYQTIQEQRQEHRRNNTGTTQEHYINKERKKKEERESDFNFSKTSEKLPPKVDLSNTPEYLNLVKSVSMKGTYDN